MTTSVSLTSVPVSWTVVVLMPPSLPASSSVPATSSPPSLADTTADPVKPAKKRRLSRSSASTTARRLQKTLSPGPRSTVSPAAPRTVSTRRSSISSPEAREAPDIAVASAISASLMLEMPPSLCVPLAVLRTRAAQAVARDSCHTPAMRQSVDIKFHHPGSALCWA